jgi:hypothetical protein
MSNPFLETYRSFSNAALLEIMQNPANFEPIAVEAVRAEINSRQLTPNDLEAAHLELERLLQPSKKRALRRQRMREALAAGYITIAEELAPSPKITDEKRIRLACYGVGLLFLFYVVPDFRFTIRILLDPHSWEFSTLLMTIMPLVAIPVGLYYFWHKHPVGWIALTVWLNIFVVYILYFWCKELQYSHEGAMGLLFRKRGAPFYIFQLLLFGGLLVHLHRSGIRSSFPISKRTQFLTLGITTIIVLIYLLKFSFLP